MLIPIQAGNVRVLEDIIIFDNNVFIEEYNNYQPNSYHIYDNSEKGYKEVTDDPSFNINAWDKKFIPEYTKTPWYNEMSDDTKEKIIKSIASLINFTLYPTSALTTEQINYTTNALLYKNDALVYGTGGIRIYLDHNRNQICEAIYEKDTPLIKMIVSRGSDYYYYEITKTTIDGDTIWDPKKKEITIWRLTTALEESKIVSQSSPKVKEIVDQQ